MLRIFFFFCSAFLISVSLATAGVGASTGGPQLSAEQIVQRSVSASGGLSAWRRVTAMTMTGQMDIGKGVKAPFTMELKRGRKVRLELQFQGQTAVQIYDGVNGWKMRPFLNRKDAEPFTPDELKQASLDSDLDGALVDYAAKGTRIDLEEVEKVENRDAYRLRLTLKNGQVRRIWIDAQNFLEVKIDGSRQMDGKQRAIETYFRDYRATQGLMMPYVFETAVEGVKGTEKIEIEKVVVNPALDDSLFARLH
jgi:outer membrane lipoprotein-sorting protein